jgi:hypothetical protein
VNMVMKVTIKDEERLDELRDCQLLKANSGPWSSLVTFSSAA